ncbi:hypothetical protein PHIN3_385 [Sinorhizobium phage phiN3]|uniref:Uncharacterized protein n=1 Tax=Sinorhizobium phage phiN3 TaxID=1647405 RepID=A0A0F6SJ62_9CAUD|nr:hypothetical protein AVT40_gp148 [Sinorhizobium phage phiN3]AKF13648.1 hypothetical protein PHIN3_385 [Sinorhizobium phage phiN3]
MPTGYTHAVAEGEITSLRDFVLSCARGMGALICMRDDPADAPVPEQFEPDVEHYNERIIDAAERIEMLREATPETIEALVAKANADALEYHNKRVDTYKRTKKRYKDMIAKVEAWQGAPEGIKEFMLQQLNSSIEFDCHRDPSDDVPTVWTAERWLAYEIEDLQDDIKRYTRYRNEEVERVAARNEWLRQLHESLKGITE